MLLIEVSGRDIKLEPYGLVFKKEYIRGKGGNPVFYVTKEIARPLWASLFQPLSENKLSDKLQEVSRLLALVTVCESGNDWHWEREWRIVGDLIFKLKDVYCGLCSEEDIAYFQSKYSQVKFISPRWGINKILNKLVREIT